MAEKQEFTLPSGIGISAYKAYLSSSTNSSSVDTGALITPGGAGFGKSVSLGGLLHLYNGNNFTALKSAAVSNAIYTLPANYPSTGSSVLQSDSSGLMSWVPMVATGGITTSGLATTAVYAYESGYAITSGLATTANYAYQSGYAITSGFATTAANVNVVNATSNSAHSLVFTPTATGSGVALSTNTTLSYNPSTNILSTSGLAITATTASTSTSTGALTVAGGVGIAGTSYFGNDVTVGNSQTGKLNFSQGVLGSAGTTTNPSLMFVGQDNNPITLSILSDNTLSFEGSSGQLFSINNNLSSGTIFSVNDISGIPIIRANANGTLSMGEFTGSVGVGLTNPSYKLHIAGDTNLSSGYVFRINGNSVLSASTLGTGVTNSSLTSVGTITTGAWAATAITAFYGGTGYNSYTKGDILVGAGNTFIKLNVGTDNYVLTASSSSSTGLTWSPTAATGITTLNSLTATQQFFSVGTSGSGFNISSSGSTHTFNIPIAGSGSTGLISTQAQTIAGQKTFTTAIIGDLTGTATTANYALQSGYAITSGLASTATLALTVSSTSTSANADYNIPFFSGTALSTNNNLYYNPSTGKFNAVVYTGSWAGNAITSLYGGTGYSTYATGELLVGAGSTLSKLSVGTDNFILVADNTVAGGIRWANISGFAITNINGLTTSKQDLAFGYSGSVPAFSSSGSTHTLNIPLAGTGSTGLVSTQSQSFAGIKTFTNAVSVTDNTGSGSYTSGALIVSGGVGIGGTLNVQGDLNVQGTFTTINSTTITVADKNIELGVVATPTDITAQGGGITLRGATDKSINWYSGVGWSSSESWNLASGNTFKINGTSVLSSSSLGTGVTNSSLTALGTITTGTWAGSTITAFYGGTGYNSFTKGDILVGAGNTFIKLNVGTDNYVLTASSTSATGLTWSPTSATGITTLNSLTANQQFFATGTSGSGFNISSSGSTHTFNIPIAGTGATGLVSTLAQSFAGVKTFTNDVIISSSTASTFIGNGALQVYGGVGISGRLSFNQAAMGFTGILTNPSLAFIGTTGSPITLSVLADNSLSFEGSSGQLFSIDNNLTTGEIFAVSDISGLPIISAYANQNVTIGEFGGNLGIGLSNPFYKLHVTGSVGFTSSAASTSTSTGALVVTGGVGIGGSLNVNSASSISSVRIDSGTVYGNLTGTATTATYAIQSGYAVTSGSSSTATTATYAYQSGYGLTSGFATTANYAYQSGYAITSGLATTATYAYQSGYAITSGLATTATYSYQAGYGLTAGLATTASYAYQSGYGLTSGLATTSTYSYQSGYGLTSGFATTANYSYQSGYGLTAGLASTATYAYQSGYGLTSGFATTANYAYQSGYGITSGFATTASYSYQSGYATTSGSSGLATTATYAHQSGYAITSGNSNTSGYATTSGLATTANYSYQSGYGITSGLATTATYAYQSGYAITSGLATTATYAYQSGYGITSGFATTASYSYQSGYATTSGIANSSYSSFVNTATANSSHPILFSPITGNSSGAGLSLNTILNYNPSSNILYTSGLAITATTASSSTSNGALTVAGGVGISGRLSFNLASFGTTGISSNPTIAMIGSTGDPIYLSVLEDNTISFEGSQGQLFSITPNLSTGYIYSVNDITGIPLLRANANANVTANEYAGNFGIGLSNPGYKLHVIGSVGFTSNISSTSTSSGTLVVSGGVGIGGSLNVNSASNISSVILNSGNIYGNLIGTATTAGFATTANYSHQSGYATTAGLATTATYSYQSGYGLTSGFASTATYSYQSGYGITAGLATTATYSHQAGYAITSGSSSSANSASIATTASNINVNTGTNNIYNPVLFTPQGTGSGVAVSSSATLGFNPTANTLSVSGLAVTASTGSTSTSTGALTVTGGLGVVGDVFVASSPNSRLSIMQSAGDEGGEIFLNKPVTNTTLNTGLTIDIYQNRLRFFEAGGSNRGFYLDIATGGNSVGTNIMGSSSSGTVNSGTATYAAYYPSSSNAVSENANLQFTGTGISIGGNIASTSTTSGSLRVFGGVGIGGSVFIGGEIRIGTNTFTKTSSGDLNFDNGTADTPGVRYYWQNNRNFGTDVYYSGSGSTRWRVVKEMGETGGAELFSIDREGVIYINNPGSGVVSLKHTGSGSATYTFPNTAPATGTSVLQSDTSGVLSWVAPTSTYANQSGYATTSGLATTATYSYQSGYGLTSGFATTANYAYQSGYAITSGSSGAATTATYAHQSGYAITSGSSGTATTATYAYQSGYGLTSGFATTASYSYQAGYAITSGSSGAATTAANINVVLAASNANHQVLFTPTSGSASGVAVSTENSFVYNPSTDILSVSGLAVTASTASTNSSTGALIVTGGVGIGQTLFTSSSFASSISGVILNNGSVSLSGTYTQSNSSITALSVKDGSNNTKFNVDTIGGIVSVSSSIASTNTSTGALIVSGGVGIGGSLYVSSATAISGVTINAGVITGSLSGTATTATYSYQSGYGLTAGLATSSYSSFINSATANILHSLIFAPVTSSSSGSGLSLNSTLNFNPSTNILNTSGLAVTASTVSSSSTTGALTVAGGLGVGSTSYFNTDLNIGNSTRGRLYFSQATLGSAGTTVIPSMAFIGTTNSPITLSVLPDNSLSFDGSSGQLFSINNNLSTGWIFSVNDISGLPIFRANADLTVAMGEYGGNTGIGLSNPSYKLHVAGDTNLSSGYVYRINGTSVLSSSSLGTGVTNSSLTALGTITIGTWSGSTITSYYGGTGYQTYSTGDILVGTGSTLTKLAVGANNFVLVADNTVAGGVKWASVSGVAITNINGLTASKQDLAFGYSGSVPAFASSGSTHTLNIPIAGSGSTGLVSTQAQTFAGQKTFTSAIIGDITGTATTAGFASTASYANQSGYGLTSGFATTSSYSHQSGYAITSGSSGTASTATYSHQSGYATTSGFATTATYSYQSGYATTSGLATTANYAHQSGYAITSASSNTSGYATTSGLATTATYAHQSGYGLTSGFATTANYSYQSGYGLTSGLATTATYSYQSGYAITSGSSGTANTASYSHQSGYAITSGNSNTSGYATTSGLATTATYAYQSGYGLTSGFATTSSYAYQSGYGITAGFATTATYSYQSGYATTSGLATTATYSYQSGYGITAGFATTANYAYQSGYAITSGNSNTSGYATTSGLATTATYSYQSGYGLTSGFASTASYAYQSGYAITSGLATTATYAYQSGYAITSGLATSSTSVFINNATSNSNHPLVFTPTLGSSSGAALSTNSTVSYNPSTNYLYTSGLAVTASTASTSTSTGALIVNGGVGISGQLSYNNALIGTTGIASQPTMTFIGANGDPVKLRVLDDSTLAFSGSQGQLFSINPVLNTGYIFSVNDISGVPLLRANADATVSMGEFAGNIGIGLSNPAYKLHVSGSVGFTSSASSTSSTTGALVVSGGVGIGGTLFSSSSYANSLSGVVLSNGVVTSGSWAGSLITGLYGGTGFNSYTKGDLLVGSGTTLIKHAVGSQNQILIADVYSGSGLSWATFANPTYGSFYSTTSQPVVGVGATTLVNFNSTYESNRVSIIGGAGTSSRVQIQDAGPFSITFSAQINLSSGNQPKVGDFWFRVNGVDVPQSNTEMTITGKDYQTVITVNFVYTFANNDYFEIAFSSLDTNYRIEALTGLTNPPRPDIPSIILSVLPVTHIVGASGAGISGILSLNGSTASQQYFVEGHSGTNFNIQTGGGTHTFNIPYASTGATGLVTTLAQSFAGVKTFTNDTVISSSTASTSFSSGALLVTGGVGIGGTLNVQGDLNVQGTFTTINSTTITVADKNIELGVVSSPTDITAQGGGITLRGATDKSINWYSGVGWSSSESLNVVSGNTYKINGTTVLSSSSLGTGVTNSSLTALGTITTGVWAGTSITALYGGTGLAPSFTVGDILYANTSTTWGRLTANSNSGYVLTSAGSGATPTYVAPSTLSVGLATTATYAHQSGYAITSGLATTATYAYQSGYGLTSGFATTAGYSHQSGYAITSGSSNTSGFASTATYAYQSGYGLTSGLATTANYAHQSGYAITSGSSNTSGYATTSGTATTATNLNVSNASTGIFYPILSNTASSASGVGASVNSFFSFNAANGAFGATSVNILAGQSYSVGGNSVLSSSSLGTGVTNSSLTALGTITTGTWSGSTITSFYGGSGYQTYTTGDLLVGAGTTLIKLAVGSNNFVLTADNTVAGGVKWTATAATGLTTLNGLNAGIQYFATGTSGSGFNISSSGSTHTFNIPIAGTGATGLVSTLAQSFAGVKTFTNDVIISSSTASTFIGNGALQVYGGVGISGRLSFNQAAMGFTGILTNPSIAFIGTTGSPITLSVLSDNSLSFEGSSGQLFSIDNNLTTGEIFAVSDISGLPIISAYANQNVTIGEFGGNLGIGLSNPFYKLHVVGSVGFTSNTASTSTSTGALIVTGGVGIGGSLNVNSASSISGVRIDSGIVYGNLTGTATTSGFATTANYSHQSGYGITAGLATTAAYSHQSGYAITSGSSGFATTATYAYQSGYGLTSGLATTATYAHQSGYAITSESSNTSGYATTSGLATTATYALTSGYGITAGLATTATYALQSGYAITSGSSGTATTATNINIVSASTSASHPVLFTPASGTVSGAAVSTESTFVYNPSTDILSVSGLAVTSGTASTTSTTGALTVTGGVGIGGRLNVGTANSTFSGDTVLASFARSVSFFTSGEAAVVIQNTNATPFSVAKLSFRDHSAKEASIKFYNSNNSGLYNNDLQINGPGNVFYNAGSGSSFEHGFTGGYGVKLYQTTASTASTNGALIVTGGAGIAKTSYFGQDVFIQGTTASGSTSTGALVVIGGVGIGGSIFTSTSNASSISGVVFNNGAITNTGTITSTGVMSLSNSSTTALSIKDGSNNTKFNVDTIGGIVSVSSSTASTSTTSGALVVTGGVGIGGSLYVTSATAISGVTINAGVITGNLTGTATTATYSHQSGYAITSGSSNTSGYATTSGFATTASYAYQSGYGLTSGLATTATYSHQSGYAITSESSNTSGYATTSGFATTATYSYTSGYGITSGLATTATYAHQSGFAQTATSASTATTATNSTYSILTADTTNATRRLVFTTNGTGSTSLYNTSTVFTNPFNSSVGASVFTGSGSVNIRPGIDATNGVSIGNSSGTPYVYFDTINGRIGINQPTPLYDLHIVGEISATNKSFVIDHPTKPDMMLRHGSLEGPENGVYVRGKLINENIIQLPDYWLGLVDEETITVSLTPVGKDSKPYLEKIENYKVYVNVETGIVNCHFVVYGERKDIPKLDVEY